MGALAYISLHTKDLGPDLDNEVFVTDSKLTFGKRLAKYLLAMLGGLKIGHLRVELETGGDGTRPSQTIAITHANVSNGDTVTIGGVVLTVAAAPANESEWASGANATADGAALAACINAHSKLKGLVTAVNASGTVTLTFSFPGRLGNLITLATSDATAFGLGAATLAGGTGSQRKALRSYEYGASS